MSNPKSESIHSGRLLAVCLTVAALYFAKDVLIPIALAILLAILLEPLSECLERLKMGRIAAALSSVILAVFVVGTLFYFVAGQFGEFGKDLPKYEKSIHDKIQKVQAGDGGAFGRAVRSIQDFRKDLSPTNSGGLATTMTNVVQGKPSNQPAPEPKVVPVEVREPDTSTVQVVRNLIGPSLNIAVTLFLVTIFCIFFLVGRDDFRARLIRIVGTGNVKVTNQFIAETGTRVTRYLMMQLIVNVCYGISIGLGLWAIGIPNPLLWGMVAALFRYIPYAGPWIAASMPLVIAFSIGTDWSKPLLVLGLFGLIEILTANLVEPWLYGNSTGITPLAVLLAAVFWTWLWGPIGLLLSMPLTVCLVSVARYVPQLELLDQLFGEREKGKGEL